MNSFSASITISEATKISAAHDDPRMAGTITAMDGLDFLVLRFDSPAQAERLAEAALAAADLLRAQTKDAHHAD